VGPRSNISPVDIELIIMKFTFPLSAQGYSPAPSCNLDHNIAETQGNSTPCFPNRVVSSYPALHGAGSRPNCLLAFTDQSVFFLEAPVIFVLWV